MDVDVAVPAPGGYRALRRVPGLLRLLSGLTLTRLAMEGMLPVALVLIALRLYGSPLIAGLAVFLAIFPGLLLSPVAGALLDLHGRVMFLLLDALVSATLVGVITAGLLTGHLPSALLLATAALISLTRPIAQSGERALIPLMTPRDHWDAANAVDNGLSTVGQLVGPPLAAALVGWSAGAAMAACALLLLAAAAVFRTVRDVGTGSGADSSLGAAIRAGVSYFIRHRILVVVAAGAWLVNITGGIAIVAVPYRLTHDLGSAPWVVGAVFALEAAFAIVSSIAAGRMSTEGRERVLMSGAALLTAAAALVLLVVPTFAGVIAGAVILGISAGPFWLALYGIRQRRTDPRFMARAFAISLAANYSGQPVGSAAGGALIGAAGIGVAFVAATIAPVIGAAVLIVGLART